MLMPVQRPWGRTVPCVPGGAVRRPVWSRVRRGREREEGRTERGRGRSCAESCGWWGRLGFLPPGRWGGGLWAEEGRALTRCLWSFLLFLLGCSLFAALQQPCGEGEGLTLGFPPPLSCHLWEPLAGESLGDALVLFPSCLANTVMAPRKQPRGHQAQWLDPPSSQLSAQSHQLGLYPHPHQHTAGIPVPRADTAFKRGLAVCLPTHPPASQTTCRSRFISCLCHFPALQPQAKDAFFRKPPWVDPSPPSPDLTLGVPLSSVGDLSGSVFRPFLKGRPFWRVTHPLPAPDRPCSSLSPWTMLS